MIIRHKCNKLHTACLNESVTLEWPDYKIFEIIYHAGCHIWSYVKNGVIISKIDACPYCEQRLDKSLIDD